MILSKLRGIVALLQFAVTVSIVIVLMYLFRSKNHTIRKIWASLQMKLLGINIEEVGELDNSADLLIANHQSLLDIVVVEYIHSRDIAWVAKKEIAKLPFFGHILKAPNMIIIDRENKAGLIKLMREVKDRLSKNRPIAIFPEGTRSDGKRVLKFKSGAKMVAQKFNLKVQPIVLIGTREIFDSKKLNAKPGVVKIIYLDSVVATKESDWFKDTENKMREILQKELSRDN